MPPARPVHLLRRADMLLILLTIVVSCLLYAYYGGGADRGVSRAELVEQSATALPAPPPGETEERPHAPSKQAAPVRFLMYNVHDYFVAKDPKRSRHTLKMKPLAEREKVADVIATVRPEVVGLVEIGGPAALDDLAERLAARGLRYPHRKALIRWTEDRALAVLSMHPIVADHSVAECKLLGNGSRRMLRGILDVSVQPAGDERVFRIIGAHLKSQVSNDPAEAEAQRTREARTLAAHIVGVLRRNPQAALLVYGDWNDGPKSTALTMLTRGCGGALKRLSPQDEHGESWTIYYRDGQEYNTFDQIYVSPALSKSMGRKSLQGIISQPSGTQPSDHRAVWCDMR